MGGYYMLLFDTVRQVHTLTQNLHYIYIYMYMYNDVCTCACVHAYVCVCMQFLLIVN